MDKKFILPFLILFLFAGCGKKQGSSVKIGFFPNITHVQALLGKEKRFADDMGCKIEWKKFNAGSTEIEAMMAGEVDIGYIGPGPAINGFIKTKGDIVIIAGACEGGALFVSRKDKKITNLRELKNFKIAVPQFGNTQHLVLKKLLDDNGLKESTKGGDVEIIQAENPDIGTLFEQKKIDAAFVPEPWGSKLVIENGANIAADYSKTWRGGEYPVAVVVARKEFIEKNPEIVANFLKTHRELTKMAVEQPQESKKTVNRELKLLTGKEISKQILDSAYKNLFITDRVEKEPIFEMKNIMEKLGVVKNKNEIETIFR